MFYEENHQTNYRCGNGSGYGSYRDGGQPDKRFRDQKPGCWQSDYWRQNENCAGIYWWTGADTPGEVYSHAWPGYKMSKVSEAGVDNLYSSPVPADAYMIIINNHIDGGMPGQPNFLQERFDAACQIKDTPAQYYAFMESPYYSKDLWKYVWDKAADEVGTNRVDIYDELLEAVDDDDFVLDIPEFGNYAKNFYVETENGDGVAQSFDNMVYVVNLDPNTNIISTTITPEGKVTYSGEWFFYYGNGEYGTWPTKELLAEHTGITFDDYGNPVLPENSDMVVDEYGTINRVVTTRDGVQQKLMVAGNFSHDCYTNNPTVPEPTGSNPDQPSYPSYNPPQGQPGTYLGTNSIYFYVNDNLWKNFNNITMYIYEHNGDACITWGSKKGNMTNCGNGFWGFDFDAKGIELDPSKQYGIIFTADWGVQTCDIIFDTSIMGDTAYSAIGNIVGEALWAGTTYYDMLVNFIKSDGPDGLENALRYNGKTAQQTLDDISDRWGLSSDDVEKAIRESGKTVDWDNSNSGSSSSGSSSSSGTWSNLLSFTVKVDGTLELTNCSGKIDEVPAVYPENIRYSVNNPFATGNEVIDYKNTPVTSIGDWAFANNKYVETVEIPDSIKKIGKGAFYNCVKLQSITKSIGDEAFYDCRRLRTLDIPASVTEIGEEAFTNCRSLTNLTIPDGVKKLGDENSVGYGMFENCKNLSWITVPASVDYINPDTFDGCGSLTICGEKNSAAQEFASNNNILFRVINEPDCMVGDINGNGTVTIDDATMVQKAVAEMVVLTGTQTLAADADGDGVVNINDATMIQKYIAELVDHLG